jgi:rhodanese-related sulfurtransferase
MKVIIIAGAVILGLVGLFLVVSNSSDSNAQNNTLDKVTVTSLESDIASGIQLIDVRTPQEFNEGHIQGASNLPLDVISAGALPETPKDQKLYLYCRSGNRSAEAKKVLEKSGYTNIVDLGGMNDVVALGAKQVN